MGSDPKTLNEFITLANAATVDVTPGEIANLLRVPGGKRPEIAILAERLKDTSFYHPRTGPAIMLTNYRRARQIRDALLEIAESGRLIRRQKDAERGGAVFLSRMLAPTPMSLAGCPVRISLPEIRIHRVAVITSDGQIGTEDAQLSFEASFFNRFAEVLHGLDASTLLKCPNCRRIFQAKRRDAVYCSNNCRQGHWRYENPIEAAAIQNRYDEKRGHLRPAPKTIARTVLRVKKGPGKRRRAPRLPGSTRRKVS